MIKRIEKSFNENKNLIEFKQDKRERIHPPATTWSEIRPENRVGFIDAATMIMAETEGLPCYAYGSRVNGNFETESDFDVAVLGIQPEDLAKLRAKLKEHNIDITGLRIGSGKYIRIPVEFIKPEGSNLAESQE